MAAYGTAVGAAVGASVGATVGAVVGGAVVGGGAEVAVGAAVVAPGPQAANTRLATTIRPINEKSLCERFISPPRDACLKTRARCERRWGRFLCLILFLLGQLIG